jgi:hypothetical protein
VTTTITVRPVQRLADRLAALADETNKLRDAYQAMLDGHPGLLTVEWDGMAKLESAADDVIVWCRNVKRMRVETEGIAAKLDDAKAARSR